MHGILFFLLPRALKSRPIDGVCPKSWELLLLVFQELTE